MSTFLFFAVMFVRFDLHFILSYLFITLPTTNLTHIWLSSSAFSPLNKMCSTSLIHDYLVSNSLFNQPEKHYCAHEGRRFYVTAFYSYREMMISLSLLYENVHIMPLPRFILFFKEIICFSPMVFGHLKGNFSEINIGCHCQLIILKMLVVWLLC